MSLAREPVYFGPASRPLFGFYHEDAAIPGDLVAVICPPLGHEYVNSHRSVRHLADALARAGVAAFRFDYDGTGDSAGSDEDPDRLEAWVGSVRVAITCARQRSGRPRVGLIGLRFGATLAALSAAASAQADSTDPAVLDFLVAWAPCARGRAYVRELKALHLTGDNRHESISDGRIEPGGFVITRETQQAVAAIDLAGLSPRTKRAALFWRDDAVADARLAAAWRAAGLQVDEVTTHGVADMFLPPHNAQVPQAAIQHIVNWVAEPSTGGVHTGTGADRARSAVVCEGVTESALECESASGARLFCIMSEGGIGPRPLVLLPNAGSTHHVGPNRLYVALARAIAASGARCVRFDLAGLGDSAALADEVENDPYPETAGAQIASVAAAMRARRDTTSVLVMGLCSGAHAAFHVALEQHDVIVDECVLINPLTFYYRRGMSLDQSASNHHEDWQRCVRNVRSLRGWSKLFSDEVDIRAVAGSIVARARDVAQNRARSARRTLGLLSAAAPSGDDALDGDLRRIAAADRKLTFVFSRYDPGHDLLRVHGGRAVKRLSRTGHVRVFQVDGANHTFEARDSRREMIDLVTRHLVARYGGSAGGGSRGQIP